MLRFFPMALGLILIAGQAWAADTTSGSSALALAALVGKHAPTISFRDKRVLSRILEGDLGFRYPAGGKIAIDAASVTCRSSDVDISEHDCTLKFGAATRTLHGRAAHELYATLVEIGAPGDGAAGSIYESVSNLACTIKPAEVKERGGGGADCSFDPGP